MPHVRGAAIQRECRRRGLARKDVAAGTGIEPRTLTNALTANGRLGWSKIKPLADFLGWDPDEVVVPEERLDASGPGDNRPPTKPKKRDEPKKDPAKEPTLRQAS